MNKQTYAILDWALIQWKIHVRKYLNVDPRIAPEYNNKKAD